MHYQGFIMKMQFIEICILEIYYLKLNFLLNSIYGNLPYIAPEVIIGKEQTFKSDIYSIAILMWEISSGQPPFINYDHDYDLAMHIVNGIRPKIVPGTPSEYKNLMKQCWDAKTTQIQFFGSRKLKFKIDPGTRGLLFISKKKFIYKIVTFDWLTFKREEFIFALEVLSRVINLPTNKFTS
ncbi:kinase-like domain-containing protein [Rhizophagus irregularis DAOM 181602=DAOM 197198]|uniref:Kinase-like domain-containing protein n=1 Tax=Rhizophagus irregularis (strain DAOM 181602 / DAOM 197198 / MUCL 43194) TaxID=747089 RepID=A0A2P4PA40_RHIID|nr:kinase-like domain-containing protein [Rhizophagus irregularis DAOM 181602=DAOM 197198]POG62253.1 kinase-like domain-containing protein [Rhizophagus irregularis DAOM 181602=DAOM 197198]|eukprot:XP_025169119.1 kinase-like domain-containing protein [Rhizophagus irregularis DAOM 181602=DAOM 197198]